MQTVSISGRKFKDLSRLRLNKDIYNSEGELYKIKDKTGKMKLIKRFNNQRGDGFGNKLLTINALIDQKEKINIENIVMPEKLVITNGNIVGFTMDYINSTNLKMVFENKNYTSKQVINYLKQIGEIFKEIEKINNDKTVDCFYLNDVHEGNFILDRNGIIHVIDIDSSRISNNDPFASRYLTPFSMVAEFPNKYHASTSPSAIGYIEPDMNSELYCYNIMILNYLYQGNVQKMHIMEFYNYLNYLKSIDFPYEILDAFSKLYSYEDNVNVKDMLDIIPNNIEKAKSKVYNQLKK